MDRQGQAGSQLALCGDEDLNSVVHPCPFRLPGRRPRYQKRAKVDFVPLQTAAHRDRGSL